MGGTDEPQGEAEIGRGMAPAGIAIIGLALVSAACGVRSHANTDRFAHDQDLVKDLPRVQIEFERRLAGSISVRGGLLFLRDPILKDLDLAVMPANAFWVLHCGIGFTIAFGGGGTAGSDGAEIESLDEDGDGVTALGGGALAGAEISLSLAAIDAKICDALAPDVGANIQRILHRR